MTLNRFLEAIAAKLAGLWPDRKVYVDEIPREADGNFFVGFIDTEQSQHLNRRRRRTLSFEVIYFLRHGDNMAFNDWLEAMYDSFEALTVNEDEEKQRIIKLKNVHARNDDEQRTYQFLFDADFFFLLEPDPEPDMESLEQRRELK